MISKADWVAPKTFQRFINPNVMMSKQICDVTAIYAIFDVQGLRKKSSIDAAKALIIPMVRKINGRIE